jgi:nucleoporin NUP2
MAHDQITRENYRDGDSSDGEDAGGARTARASSEVMAKRIIVMPKGRKLKQLPAQAGATVQPPTTTTANLAHLEVCHQVKALNQAFVHAVGAANLPNTIANLTPLAEKYIEYYKQIQNGLANNAGFPSSTSGLVSTTTKVMPTGAAPAPAPAAAPVPASASDTSKPNPFAFLKSSSQTSDSKPTLSFSFGNTTPSTTATTTATSKPSSFPSSNDKPAFPPPQKLAFSFGTSTAPSVGTEPKPKPQPVPESTKLSGETNTPQVDTSKIALAQDSDSDSDSEEEVKIQGPSFSLSSKPVIKNSPFSFGPKPAKKDDSDSDSDSEIEIKGPTFTFNKQIKDDVFKFKEADKRASQPFSFGNVSSENKANTTAAPASTEKLPETGFSFGKATTASDATKPTFSFGKPSSESSNEKPLFSFGKPSTEQTTEKAQKPAFTFSKPTNESTEKPAFTFGKPQSENNTDKSDKPAFNFGQLETEKPTTKPTFNFGKTEQKNTESSGFSFGSNDSAKSGFSFGANSSFGQSKNQTDKAQDATETKEKPTFSFGSSDKPSFGTSDKPAFSFGASDKPSFNFKPQNKDSNEPSSNSNNNSTLPSFGSKPTISFNFGAKPASTETSDNATNGEEKLKFQFSFNPPANKNLPDASTNANNDDKVPEEETGGDFKPVAQLTSEKVDASTGEENEDVTYTKRAKLMLFDKSKEQPYVNKGVGDLKVLKQKDTGKSRILIRADGGLRVLLNNAISKDISYTSLGDGSMVRVPTVNATTKEIETFVVKVKTAEDGKNLLSAINEAKPN